MQVRKADPRAVAAVAATLAVAMAVPVLGAGGGGGTLKKTGSKTYSYSVHLPTAIAGYEIDTKHAEQFVSGTGPHPFACSHTYSTGVPLVAHHDHLDCEFGTAPAGKTLKGTFKLNKALAKGEGATLYAHPTHAAGRIGPFSITGP
jgi:hypothetical protein